MKKLLFLFSMIIAVTTIAMKPLTKNVPIYHTTKGDIHPPIVVLQNANPDVWTIINNSGCDYSIDLWVTIEGHEPIKLLAHEIKTGETSYYSADEIRHMLGLDDGSAFTLTQISAEIDLKSTGERIGDTYPSDNFDLKNVDLPEPCNCVHVKFDRFTSTLTLSNCK